MGSVIAALLHEAYLRLTHQSKSASCAGSGEELERAIPLSPSKPDARCSRKADTAGGSATGVSS